MTLCHPGCNLRSKSRARQTVILCSLLKGLNLKSPRNIPKKIPSCQIIRFRLEAWSARCRMWTCPTGPVPSSRCHQIVACFIYVGVLFGGLSVLIVASVVRMFWGLVLPYLCAASCAAGCVTYRPPGFKPEALAQVRGLPGCVFTYGSIV